MKGVLMAAAMLCCSCSGQRPDRGFYTRVRERCEKEQPCEIRMAEQTERAWDKVYVFEPRVMEYEIKEVLGESVAVSGRYAYKIIFTRDNKIVDDFDSLIIVDDYQDEGSVFFPGSPGLTNHRVYDSDVVFDVKMEGNSYHLSCHNCATDTTAQAPPQ